MPLGGDPEPYFYVLYKNRYENTYFAFYFIFHDIFVFFGIFFPSERLQSTIIYQLAY